MDNTLETFAGVIDTLGGSAVVAAGIKAEAGTVRQWRNRGSIPASVWPQIVSFANDQNVNSITLEALAALAARKSRRRAA